MDYIRYNFNQLITSRSGHNNHIKTIRYFINIKIKMNI